MNLKKKSAVILALMLVLSLMPLQAFAADEAQTGDTAPAAGTEQTEPATPAVTPAPAAPKKTGWQTVKGVLYYYDSNGNLSTLTGWQTIGGAKYYGLGGGRFANKPTKIKKVKTVTKKVKNKKVKKKVTKSAIYMFGKDGKLITKKGLFKYKGKEYYGLGKGKLHTGWKAFKEKGKAKAAYFNKKTGAMKKGGKVKYLKIPKNGRLGEAYALGIKKLNKTKWTLRQAYINSYRLRYYGRWWRQPSAEKYALRGFKQGRGNCYVMASTFYIQAKLLGYDVHQVQGKVAHRYPHSWTVIRQNGREWVYDPNFRNETGGNGWKIWYGKKGTWRYTGYRKMN